MYSFLVARSYIRSAIKDENSYEWFTYRKGSPVEIDYRGKAVTIVKGDRFGVRKSRNGREIRLIMKDAPTKVYTLTLEQARKLAKGV